MAGGTGPAGSYGVTGMVTVMDPRAAYNNGGVDSEAGYETGPDPGFIIGVSPAMQMVWEAMEKVAPTNATVLFEGETGTGKTLVGRELYHMSRRRGMPFVHVSCAEYPDQLIESALFGHVKGAYTHAVSDRIGLFEEADGGTLYLDEIGSSPKKFQVGLLRLLETGEYKPIGSEQIKHADVRILAASSNPVKEMVTEGTFREDLFYRLHVFPIRIPPLRERPEDIEYLARYFAAAFGHEIDEKALEILTYGYEWPGNARELKSVIERVSVMADHDGVTLGWENLRDWSGIFPHSKPARPARRFSGPSKYGTYGSQLARDGETFRDAKASFEKRYIESLLLKHGGAVKDAAEEAGISRAHFYELRKKHRIDSAEFEHKAEAGEPVS